MTSPPEDIQVKCPKCGRVYKDWYRPSLNLQLDPWIDEDYIRKATTATCPDCGTVVELGGLIVDKRGVFKVK